MKISIVKYMYKITVEHMTNLPYRIKQFLNCIICRVIDEQSETKTTEVAVYRYEV